MYVRNVPEALLRQVRSQDALDGVTMRDFAERVSGGETPLAQTAAVASGVSSGRLIHVVSGIRGALGGWRNRSGRLV